jgi:hypothetical protein
MPFGLKYVLLAQCSSFVRAYIDDIVIYSNSWEENLAHLRKVFNTLRQAGLKVKPSKCSIAMQHCSYLGHGVGGGKVGMDIAKTEAIRNFHRSRTKKKDVRAFLGLAGYYRRFIPDFSTITAPLSDLTRKVMSKHVKWNENLEKSFTALKGMLARDPILACPDSNRSFRLQTDASERGLGAVLSQEGEDGVEHPVACFSKKLLPRETR